MNVLFKFILKAKNMYVSMNLECFTRASWGAEGTNDKDTS